MPAKAGIVNNDIRHTIYDIRMYILYDRPQKMSVIFQKNLRETAVLVRSPEGVPRTAFRVLRAVDSILGIFGAFSSFSPFLLCSTGRQYL